MCCVEAVLIILIQESVGPCSCFSEWTSKCVKLHLSLWTRNPAFFTSWLPFLSLRMMFLHIREEILSSVVILLSKWLLLNITGPVLLIFYYLDVFSSPQCYMDFALKPRFYTAAFNLLHFFYRSGSYTYFLLLPQWKPLEAHTALLDLWAQISEIRPLHTSLVPMNNFFPLLAYCCSGLCLICMDTYLTQILRVYHVLPYPNLIIGYSNKWSM